ncbi:MAG: alpha/beta hydrolase [Clostridiaceae bacterium]|nr:alpha/beta hydrolase [Clostridiaceae bacterium]
MSAKKKENKDSIFTSEFGRARIIEHYDRLLSKVEFEYKEYCVETSFGTTYILESGSDGNPPLLLLHGSTSNSAAWFSDIPELGKHYRVFAVDLIGDAGHSAKTRPDVRSDGYALWLAEVFERIGIRKASIMGNSLGAWIAIKFAVTFPEKVDKLVLLAASGIASLRVCWIFRLILFSLQGEKGAEKITQMVYGNDPIPQEVKDYLSLISENYRPYTGAIPVFPDAELRRLEMPILYIGGENDRLTNAPKCEMRLRKVLPHTDIVILKNRGHVIYNVLDRVMPFLCG